jgi:hypothetical protein
MRSRDMFESGTAPREGELSGEYMVKLVLPFFQVRFLGHTKIFPSGGMMGCNRFLGFLRIARFTVSYGSRDGAGGPASIVYDHPQNLFFVRRLTDVVRRAGDGAYIGKGLYRILGKRINIFYFTLNRI